MFIKIILIAFIAFFQFASALEISDVTLESEYSIITVELHNGDLYIISRTKFNNNFTLVKFDGQNAMEIPQEIVINGTPEDLKISTDSKIAFNGNDLWISGINGLFKYDGVNWEFFHYQENYYTITYSDITFDKNGILWGNAITKPHSESFIYKFDGDFEIFLRSEVFMEFYHTTLGNTIASVDDKVIFGKNRVGKLDTFDNPVLDSNSIIAWDGNKFSGYNIATSDGTDVSKIISNMQYNEKGNLVISTRNMLHSNKEDSIYQHYGAGLSEMTPDGNWIVYDTTHGLPYNYKKKTYEDINDFEIDNDGNYWVTNDRNILFVNPENYVIKMNWDDILNHSEFFKLNENITDSDINQHFYDLSAEAASIGGLKQIIIDSQNNIYIVMSSRGILKYSPPTSDVILNKYDDLLIYPNPVHPNRKFTINSGSQLIKEVSVYDIQGNNILNHQLSGEKFLELELPDNISSGTYFVNIETDNIIITKKIIYNE